jgi:MSHA biogenesis protein MshL
MRAELPNLPRQQVEPKFDLAVNGAPAREVFLSIVSGTRYSMVIHPDVGGVLSVNLKDVTVREALESIREVYGYEFKVDGARVYIQPAGLQTRVFQVNYLIGLRAGRSDVRVSSGSISGNVPGQGNTTTNSTITGAAAGGGAAAAGGANATAPATLSAIGASALSGNSSDASRVSTVSQTDFWTEVQQALRILVGGGDGRSVVVSPQSGVVVVRAMPEELRSVETYLKAMRISIERQVMIEAKVIDVTLNDGSEHKGICRKPPGTWGIPVDAAQHGAKIRDCLGVRFDAAKTARVIEGFEQLERLDAAQLGELLALLG